MKKKIILLTGASGNMGQAGVIKLLRHKDQFELVLFSLPTDKDKKILSKYENESNIRIIWGDLTDYKDVKKAIEGVDIILHVLLCVKKQFSIGRY
jgi:FlaA1/EpsC-like NDP-sugar epimerase